MSTAISSNRQPRSLGTIRVVIIAGVAAFVLGGLSAFVHKAVATNPNPPVASSGSTTSSM